MKSPFANPDGNVLVFIRPCWYQVHTPNFVASLRVGTAFGTVVEEAPALRWAHGLPFHCVEAEGRLRGWTFERLGATLPGCVQTLLP